MRDNVQLLLKDCTQHMGREREQYLFFNLESLTEHLDVEDTPYIRNQIHDIETELCRSVTSMLVAVAKRTWAKTVLDQDSLLSEGMNILFNCIYGFNPRKGYRFATYFCKALYNGFATAARNEQKHQKNRTIGFSVDESGARASEDSTTLDELPFPEKQKDVESLMDLQDILAANTANLTPYEQFIIRHRFGIGNAKPCTIQEVGDIVGKTKEGARQNLNKALGKLRLAMVKK